MNKKLAIYGPYPPPLGGISVHIKRIEHFLKKANIDYTIFNFGSYEKENVIPTNKSVFWYLRILFIKKYNLIHFHEMVIKIDYLYYLIFSHLNKTSFIITIHSGVVSRFNLFCLSKTKNLKVISVSNDINELLVSKNINSVFLPAYVPPSNVQTVSVKKDERKLFIFSVWKMDAKLSENIYNIPLAFEFLKRNKKEYSMLLLIGNKNISDTTYLNGLISKYDLLDSVLVLYDKNLVDYIKNCDFLLKTNKIDGYGIALQEAMDLGIPAIASDVCLRPMGTVLFKDNNIEDLSQKISETMEKPKNSFLSEKEDLQYHLELIKIYKNLLNKQ